jgi:hypothetical protein
MQNRPFDLHREIYERFRANQGVVWLVGDEPMRYLEVLAQVAERLTEERADRPVTVWHHDKLGGWHRGLPRLDMPKDGSNDTQIALQQAIATREQIAQINMDLIPPFDPAADLILAFNDVHDHIERSPIVVQQIRNIISANLCAESYAEEEDVEGHRGRRMLVFITPKAKLLLPCGQPVPIPEIKPIIVPLPDDEAMLELAREQFEDLAAANAGDPGKGVPMPTDMQLEFIAESLLGLTTNAARDALSRGIIANKQLDDDGKALLDLDGLYQDIETDKAMIINEIQGLTYVSKREMPPDVLPGYERVVDFVQDRMAIKPSVAKAHGNFQPLQGFMLAGAPGCGKTEMAKLVARLTDRIMIVWNLGESQSGLVGASEQNARKALQVIQALRAVVLLDDVDKAGTAAAAKGNSGDSGVMGRIVQMLLTEMSSPSNRAIWVFTANRVANIDTALKRAGRLDAQFYVEMPDERTRYHILLNHLKRFNLTADDESKLRLLTSDEFTGRWSGAELAHVLIKEAAVRALRNEQTVVDTTWMLKHARKTVPFAMQDANKADIEQMEQDCRQFIRIGRVPADENEPTTIPTSGTPRRTQKRRIDA